MWRAEPCHAIPEEKDGLRLTLRLVMACRAPIEWEAPTGQVAKVNLQLQFSSFFGYAGAADTEPGYLGLQCHGCLWPVNDADLPHYWPIAPPIVSGKVRLLPPL